eukprot:8971388-Heterocapsa_arctica.AAC.1
MADSSGWGPPGWTASEDSPFGDSAEDIAPPEFREIMSDYAASCDPSTLSDYGRSVARQAEGRSSSLFSE